eukprot:scaffold358_cov256-Pinguiococcus_pyrenoidosus.AAC.28
MISPAIRSSATSCPTSPGLPGASSTSLKFRHLSRTADCRRHAATSPDNLLTIALRLGTAQVRSEEGRHEKAAQGGSGASCGTWYDGVQTREPAVQTKLAWQRSSWTTFHHLTGDAQDQGGPQEVRLLRARLRQELPAP